MAGDFAEEARALREEQLDGMSALELADMADVGRGKLEEIDARLKGKISGEAAAILAKLQIGMESENLWVGIDINGGIVVCDLLKAKNSGEEPLPLSQLSEAFGIEKLRSEICGERMLRITFSLKDYIQVKRKDGGFGNVMPVAEGDEALEVVDDLGAQIRAANPAFARQDAGRERDETPGDEVIHEGAE